MIQFKNLLTMPQEWRSWLPEILRTYCRYLDFSWPFFPLIKTFKVCCSSIWRSLSRCTQQNRLGSHLWNGNLAFPSQTSTPYWINCGITCDINHSTWHRLAQVRLHHLWSLHNQGPSFWGGSTRSMPSRSCAEKRDKWKATFKSLWNIHQYLVNLSAYKPHAIPDYAQYICLYGTTDGFTSQVVSCPSSNNTHRCLTSSIQGELEHQQAKHFRPWVHKGKFKFVCGIARHVRRERILHNMRKKLPLQPPSKKQKLTCTSQTSFLLPFSATETFQSTSPNQHYEMSHDTKFPIDITIDLGDNLDDPAQTIHWLYICHSNHLNHSLLGNSWSTNRSPARLNSSTWLSRQWHPIHWWWACHLEICQQSPLSTQSTLHQLHILQYETRTRLTEPMHPCKHHDAFTW